MSFATITCHVVIARNVGPYALWFGILAVR